MQQFCSSSFEIPSPKDAVEIAILIPCYNEQETIGQVVSDFHQLLPQATVFVYDNASTDRSQEIAAQAGAVVRCVELQETEAINRRMFADIEADIYVLYDRNQSCDYTVTQEMVDLLLDNNLDMVVAASRGNDNPSGFSCPDICEKILSAVLQKISQTGISDAHSGFRVMSRRLVKSFPALPVRLPLLLSLTLHAVNNEMPVYEVDVAQRKSQVSGYQETSRSMPAQLVYLASAMIVLVSRLRPFWIFGAVSGLLILAGFISVFPYILSGGSLRSFMDSFVGGVFMLLGSSVFLIGLVVRNLVKRQRDIIYLKYLSIPGPVRCLDFQRRSITRTIDGKQVLSAACLQK